MFDRWIWQWDWLSQKIRKTHGEHYCNYSGEGSCRCSVPYMKNTKIMKGEQITTNLEMEEITRFSDWQNIKRKGKEDVRISNMGNSAVGVIPLIQRRKKERWPVSRGRWVISWKVTKQFGQCQNIWEEHWGGSQVPSLSICVTLAANVHHPKLQLFTVK